MQDPGGEKPSAFEATALLPRYSPSADVADCSSIETPQRNSSSAQQEPDESCSFNELDQDEAPKHHIFSVDGAAPDQKAILRKVDSHILPFFFSTSLLCSIDRANLSYAALQLNHDLEFSQTVYGFGSGLFFLGYMVLQVPSAYICARVGAPRFLGAILVAWGIVATLFAWMQTSTQFYVLRLTLGLAESGAYPGKGGDFTAAASIMAFTDSGMWSLMARFYDDNEMGVAYATVTTATAAAMVLGGPIAAGLLMLDGLGGLHGWQWLFLLEGVPAVALGIVIWFVLADSPESAAFLDPEQRQWLVDRKTKKPQPKAVPQEEQQGDERLVHSKFAEVQQTEPFYRSWCMWYLGTVFALVVTAGDGIVFWAPIFIHDMFDKDSASGTAGAAEAVQEVGVSTWATVQAALLSAIPFGFASISMLVVAQMAKRAQERHWHGAVMMFLGSLSLALMAAFMGRVGWAAIICLTFAAAGIWSTQGPLLSWPAAILQGTNAAAGFALMKMLACVGSFSGPFLIGALSDANRGSFAPALLLLSALLLLASVMNLFFKEPGSSQGIFPRIPYSCGAPLQKRSRSDPSNITLSPTLRQIIGTRDDDLEVTGRAGAVESLPMQKQKRWRPGLTPLEERPAGHLRGEDSVVGRAGPPSKTVRGESQFFAFI